MSSSEPRIGSLFSGYGGLDMGIIAVLGGEVVWHVEFDDPPSRILSHHWPAVPNYGDITTVDWATVPPVDILTGGFPCQDVSLAGGRKGLRDGTRSGLWSHFALAIDALRPGLVVIENVRGLLSASAGDSREWTDEEISDLESARGSLGESRRSDRPVLRALGAVLGDLASLGYDASWHGIRAADAGAPHGRFRVFILAYPSGSRLTEGQDTRAGGGHESARAWGMEPQRSDREPATADSEHQLGKRPGRARGRGSESTDGALADSSGERLGEHPGGAPQEEARPAGSHLANGDSGSRPNQDGGKAPADSSSDGREGDGALGLAAEHHAASSGASATADSHHSGIPLGPVSVEPEYSPAERSGEATPNPSGDGLGGNQELDGEQEARLEPPQRIYPDGRIAPNPSSGGGHEGDGSAGVETESPNGAGMANERGSRPSGTEWGAYLPAIRRWEEVTGRVAPAPTKPDGKGGGHRLSAEFVEWMMGLPAGHVTSPEIGLSRNQQLKACGNGVVPQQAELAVRYLLSTLH